MSITWNTGTAAMRFRSKRKQKSEPPVDHKLVHKLHEAWATANGYRQASNKRAKKDLDSYEIPDIK